jgi:hypothetical protein
MFFCHPSITNTMQTLVHPAFREAGMKSAFEIAKLINQPDHTCISLTQVLILRKNSFRWNVVEIEGKVVFVSRDLPAVSLGTRVWTGVVMSLCLQHPS